MIQDMKVEFTKAEFAKALGFTSVGPQLFTAMKMLEKVLMILILLTNVFLLVGLSNDTKAAAQSFTAPDLSFGSTWPLGLAFILELAALLICLLLAIFNGLELPRLVRTAIASPRLIRAKDITKSLYYIVYLLLLLLGIFNPWPIIVLLYDFFVNVNEARQLVGSIYFSFSRLAAIVFLLVAINYLFTIVVYFTTRYQNYDPACSSFLGCLGMIYDQTYKLGGGFVSGANVDLDPLDQSYYKIETIVFDFVYIFLVAVIIEELVGAVIVDTFLQIRNNEEEIELEKKERCFICGLETAELDHLESGFHNHITVYHNMWAYLYFLVYLEFKNPELYSGIESFVHKCKEKDSL
jgi:hypothetical protein